MAVEGVTWMDAVAESGRNPVSKHRIQPAYVWRMDGPTRDKTAEPVSRDQRFRRE